MNETSPTPALRTAGRFVLHVVAGIVLGVFFHYLLYRIFLPVEPFIYVAF